MSWSVTKTTNILTFRDHETNKRITRKYNKDTFFDDIQQLEHKVNNTCPLDIQQQLYKEVCEYSNKDISSSFTFPKGTIIPDILQTLTDVQEISNILKLGVITYHKVIEISQNQNNTLLESEREAHSEDIKKLRESIISEFTAKESILIQDYNSKILKRDQDILELTQKLHEQISHYNTQLSTIRSDYETISKEQFQHLRDSYENTIDKLKHDTSSLQETIQHNRSHYENELTKKYNEGLLHATSNADIKLSIYQQQINELKMEKNRLLELEQQIKNDNNTIRDTLQTEYKRFEEEKRNLYDLALKKGEDTYIKQIEELKLEKKSLNEQLAYLNQARLNSSNLGKEGEFNLEVLLLDTFPDSSFEVPGSHSGDFIQTYNSINILWEVKNHNTRIPKPDVDKFIRDMQIHNNIQIGIMVAINATIDAHNSNNGFEIQFIDNKRCVIYLSKFNSHPNPSFILRIIASVFSIISKQSFDTTDIDALKQKLSLILTLSNTQFSEWKKQKRQLEAIIKSSDTFFDKLMNFLT